MGIERDLYQRFTLGRVAKEVGSSYRVVRRRIIEQGGRIRGSGERAPFQFRDMLPCCRRCGIVLTRTNLIGHEADKPDAGICWMCTEEEASARG